MTARYSIRPRRRYLAVISNIERALIMRLGKGLGKLVTTVASYGGELDDDGLHQVIGQLPACWIVFGGISTSTAHGTSRRRWQDKGKFSVLCAARSYRSEAASRAGGDSYWEIGSYDLITAVRRLLIAQDLGLAIDPLAPGAVRSLFNSRLEQNEALSVFAVEFTTHWYSDALPNGAWPQPPQKTKTDGAGKIQRDAAGWPLDTPDPDHADSVFGVYAAAEDPPDPWFRGVSAQIKQSRRADGDPADLAADIPLNPIKNDGDTDADV